MEKIEVMVGDTWEDCDPRRKGRQFIVQEISDETVLVLSKGKRLRIMLRCMKGTNTRGYRLVSRANESRPEISEAQGAV